jgi:predicted ATPase/DNA-binding SARP family transcriptional activator/Tfp pilus assembly protein PilF
MSLRLFGSPQLVRADGTAIALRSRKHLALLIYLAIEQRHPSTRDTLIALLWPDAGEEAARNNLRVALADVRHSLDDGAVSLLQTTRLTVQLNPASLHILDVQQFRALIDTSSHHHHNSLQSCTICLVSLEQAVELYGSEFLHGFSLPNNSLFEEWALLQREQLHQMALEALATLAAARERQGDHAAQCRYARRQIELEPWREQAHGQLMRGLWANGERGAALEQYDACCRILNAELGLDPSPELTALCEQMRASTIGNQGEAQPAFGRFTTLDPHPSIAQHNLPAPLTTFVGRTTELNELTELLHTPGIRILTLVGVGGMGKTHLAIELARRNLDAFADGVCFVPLAPLARADELPAALLHALDLPPQRGDPMELIRQALRDKHMLLLLDNFEHLLDGATLVAELLQVTPRLQIVATSRERLNLRGEQRYIVSGLAYDDSSGCDAAELPAVKLFVQNARRVQPRFRLGAGDLADVLQICRLMLGMPLGLELAAAWVALLPLAEIAVQIQHSGDFLASELRDLPERQRSMRAVFNWSWRLLRPEEQRIFRQLAVFRGGFTLETAQRIAQATLQTLLRLVEHSLVQAGAGRYEIHELLRQFADEQLDTAGERIETEQRHHQFFLAFVAEHERWIFRDQPVQAVAEIRNELDNIRQAWRLASVHSDAQALGQSACTLALFYKLYGAASEWDQMVVLAITQLQARLGHIADDTSLRQVLSRLMALAGSVCILQGKHSQAHTWAEQAIELGTASGDNIGSITGMLVMGQTLRRQGHSEQAREMLERTAALAQRYQQSGALAEQVAEVEFTAYNWLCSIALTGDEYAAASGYVEQGMQLCQRLGKVAGIMIAQSDQLDIAFATGDYAAAGRHGEEALKLSQQLMYRRMEAAIYSVLGVLARLQGDYTRAYELAAQGLISFRAMGDLVGQVTTCNDIGYVQLLLGDYAGAQSWFERALSALCAADMPAREVLQTSLRLAQVAQAVGNRDRALFYAIEAVEMARQLDGTSSQAQAWTVLGSVYAQQGQLEQADQAYTQALACAKERDRTAITAMPHAGLAMLALERGDRAAALAYVELLLPVLADDLNTGLDEPFGTYLACYRVLVEFADPRAGPLLIRARQLLDWYSEKITDPTLRKSFVNLPTHHALIAAQANA